MFQFTVSRLFTIVINFASSIHVENLTFQGMKSQGMTLKTIA